MVKTKRVAVILMVLLIISTAFVYADEEVNSLDNVIENNNSTSATDGGTLSEQTVDSAQVGTSTSNQTTDSDADDIANLIGNSANLTEEADRITPFAEKAQKAGSILFNVIAVVVSVGIGVCAAIDILYIAVKPARGLLGGNEQAQQGMGQNQGMGMGTGMMGGGYSSPYGGYGGRYGGSYGGAYGAGMGMNGYGSQGGMTGMGDAGGMFNRSGMVSEAAIVAVQMSQQPTETGGVRSPFKAYFKHMIINLTIPPVLLILAGSGALTVIGVKVAMVLVNALSGVAIG